MPFTADAPDALPRVTAYLAGLPAGVRSHPECLARAALLRRAIADRPLERRHVVALPAPVARVVTCPPLDGEWVPDVWLACVCLAIADAHAMTDDEYLSWLRGLNVRMFDTMFRLVIKVLSPEFLVERAAERWSVFHRGSALAVVGSAPGRCDLELTFPPRLFHGLSLRQFAPIFEAAVQMCDPYAHVALVESSDARGRFVATWRA